ncbi:NADH:ubiquinone reductase (Na(+)-transporting) subunit C [bacterium]|nr:NADH:ubiquinone reductase (Na(+)-transporting) subunit C [bacterium]
MHSNAYTIAFSLAVCVTCSLILALTAGGLKPIIERNEVFDIHRNILKSVDLYSKDNKSTPEQIENMYLERIKGFVIDENGILIPGKKPDDIDPDTENNLLPVFARLDGKTVAAYSIPISGLGLWSTLYGYLAIQNDGETIMGITFYKHGETPGLGGEIEADWFTSNFKGKKIFNSVGVLTSITVAKGGVSKDLPEISRIHTVDGISGATMTGNGVNVFLKADLEKYEPFLKNVRIGNIPAISAEQ